MNGHFMAKKYTPRFHGDKRSCGMIKTQKKCEDPNKHGGFCMWNKKKEKCEWKEGFP